MIFKIKTSMKTMEIFETIGASEYLQPFALSKLSIALSLKLDKKLQDEDFATDTEGLELNRQTITGDYDALFKCLIEMYEGRHLLEEEYFPKYVKAHLDRGAKLLESEHRYGGDLLTQLLKEDKGI